MRKHSTSKVHRCKDSEGQCVHHWIIEPPDQIVSKGVCIKCGAKKSFLNKAELQYQNDLLFPSQRPYGKD